MRPIPRAGSSRCTRRSRSRRLAALDAFEGEDYRRDPVAVYAFHVLVPAGARSVTLGFTIIADRDTLHRDRIDLQWQRALLYPAGWFARDLPVSARLRIPAEMTPFTALDRIGTDPADLQFATTALDRLVDAPVYAARTVRQIDLAPGDPQPVRLDLVARDSAKLAIGDRETAELRTLLETRRGRPDAHAALHAERLPRGREVRVAWRR